MFGKRRVEKRHIAVDASTRHTDVQLAPEICLERSETFLEAALFADVDTDVGKAVSDL